MKRLLSMAACAALTAVSVRAAEPSARASFDAGLQAFAASNWPAASNAFLEAAAAAPAMPMPTMTTQELAGAEASVGEAIQMYENAIALDPQDLDAKANYELAVLKQQQIQQQKQQQQQQDQQNQDQQNQDQQKQDQQKQEEQQDQKKDQQQQQQQAQQQPQPENQPEENQQQEEQQIQEEKPSEEMTPEEAAMMLDSMKAQEQSQRDRLHPFFGRPVPVEKDW